MYKSAAIIFGSLQPWIFSWTIPPYMFLSLLVLTPNGRGGFNVTHASLLCASVPLWQN
jgi:hypothetical protein